MEAKVFIILYKTVNKELKHLCTLDILYCIYATKNFTVADG